MVEVDELLIKTEPITSYMAKHLRVLGSRNGPTRAFSKVRTKANKKKYVSNWFCKDLVIKFSFK